MSPLIEKLEELAEASNATALDLFDSLREALLRAVTDLEEDGSFDITLAALEKTVCA